MKRTFRELSANCGLPSQTLLICRVCLESSLHHLYAHVTTSSAQESKTSPNNTLGRRYTDLLQAGPRCAERLVTLCTDLLEVHNLFVQLGSLQEPCTA